MKKFLGLLCLSPISAIFVYMAITDPFTQSMMFLLAVLGLAGFGVHLLLSFK